MAKPKANPGRGGGKPNAQDARAALNKLEAAFLQDFTRSDGRKFTLVTDVIKDFNDLVDAGNADALANYLENPSQLLLALVFALNERVKALERH
jgi:hypothetical protein